MGLLRREPVRRTCTQAIVGPMLVSSIQCRNAGASGGCGCATRRGPPSRQPLGEPGVVDRVWRPVRGGLPASGQARGGRGGRGGARRVPVRVPGEFGAVRRACLAEERHSKPGVLGLHVVALRGRLPEAGQARDWRTPQPRGRVWGS